MKQVLQLRLHLCSDTIFGSGASIPGGEDIALRTDSAGYPLLAGSTLKGLLRESVTDLLCWTDGDSTLPGLLFGSEGWTGEDSRRVIFSDLRLENPPADLEACTALRTFTALENGIVREGTLRVASWGSRLPRHRLTKAQHPSPIITAMARDTTVSGKTTPLAALPKEPR